ncbi:MAG: hypothetical protein Q9Q40_01125 [Acidobacteriota bacterium]|nr:hypothetical protein [Acidobacteriota bacterium]
MGEKRNRRWRVVANGCGILAGVVLAWPAGPPAAGQTVVQVTDVKTTVAGPPVLDDAGTFVYTGSSADLAGENPSHAFQVVRFDAASGAAEALTAVERGSAALVSVSDDGVWLAFPSPADLVGENHDRGSELYLYRSDGTETRQLTHEAAPDGGGVGLVALAGSGSRVVFVANTDPLGENADNLSQLFAVDADGTGLVQLTHFTAGGFDSLSISDDGARVVFVSDGDPLGGNPDRGDEVFAVLADGTGLRQLTTTAAGYAAPAASLSGDGSTIAFQSSGDPLGGNPDHWDEIFAIAWDGTGLRQLTQTQVALGVTGDPASRAPSISDDGQLVVYHSNHGTLFANLDGNFEIFRVGSDGTGRTQLTSTLLEAGSFLPTFAGGAGRIAFYALDSELRLRVMDGNGNGERDLLVMDTTSHQEPTLSRPGDLAVFVRRTGVLGGGDLWRQQPPGAPSEKITSLGGGTPAGPVLSDGGTIYFSADSNPGGGLANLDGSEEIFSVQADGSGLTQRTSAGAGTASRRPAVSADATVVVFDSDADLDASNPDGSREIFRLDPTAGNAVTALTSGPAGTASARARIDAAGGWVVFESNADLAGGNADGGYEIFRVPASGGAVEQITDSASPSRAPDISDDGGIIAFASSGDLAGANADGNSEIFVYEPAGPTLRQLTDTTKGGSGGVRLSRDGQWVYFFSDAPFFEDDPDAPVDLYRVPAQGGGVERVSALRAGLLGGLGDVGSLAGGSLGIGDDAGRVLFSGVGDFTEQNPDLLGELWLVDAGRAPRIEVSKAAPTVLHWRHESGPLRYDAIRGSVDQLGVGDLGPVVCLEDDSPDADTEGFGDSQAPAPGQAFFYLYRGTRGLLDGPGSYGRSSGGSERRPASGGCS